jgi:hypothetical protein
MKMFVWLDPGDISYGSDFVAVVAPNLRAARKIGCLNYSFGRDHPRDMVAVPDTKPDVVLDLPCGVYHMHSE